VYGTPPSYVDAAQASLNAVAASAQDAISAALYGTTATGITASITSAGSDVYSSVSSVAAESAAAVSSAMDATQSKIKEAIYGPEKGAMESAQGKLSAAVESARAKLAEFGAGTQEVAEDIVNSLSSIAAKATGKAKDEL